jgi:hypothetical protein
MQALKGRWLFVQGRVGGVTNLKYWGDNEGSVEFWDIARQ